MKRYIAVFLMLACTGCAPVTTKVNVPDIAKSDSLPVSDMRPVSEKESRIFSLLITSKEYGVIRTGDARLSPSPVRLLQHQAFQKLGDAAQSSKVIVYHFVIYQNMKSQLRSGAIGAGLGGMLGAAVGSAMGRHDASSQTQIIDGKNFDSVSDEYQRGLYTGTENPDKASVYILYLDTDIDGKRVFTRTIASMEKHGDRNPLADAVQLAIRNHLSHYDASASAETTVSAVSNAPVDVAANSTPDDPSTVQPSGSIVTAAAVSTPVQPASSQVSAASAAIMSMAQDLANQLGCGSVQANGDSTYVAPCDTYSVLIDCSGDQCRPMHTITIKHDE